MTVLTTCWSARPAGRATGAKVVGIKLRAHVQPSIGSGDYRSGLRVPRIGQSRASDRQDGVWVSISNYFVALRSPVHLRALLQSGANINNPRVHGYLMAISFGLLVRPAAETRSGAWSIPVAPLFWLAADGMLCLTSQLPLSAIFSRNFKEFTPAVGGIMTSLRH